MIHAPGVNEASASIGLPKRILAPPPEVLQERGLAAPGLLAHLLLSKYGDNLPLYRQEQIFARRHGIHLPRQTLARWMELAADWFCNRFTKLSAPACSAARKEDLGAFCQTHLPNASRCRPIRGVIVTDRLAVSARGGARQLCPQL